MAWNGLSDSQLSEIKKRNQKTVSTIENNQRAIRAQAGGYNGGSGNAYKMSADTYDRYEADYTTWKKTGKHTSDFSTWGNQKELDIWKSIRDGKVMSAKVGGDIYYMGKDAYRKYSGDYDTWAKTGSHLSDFDTWGDNDGTTAFRYIRDEQKGYGGLNNLKASLDDELTQAVAKKFRSQWGDKYYYDVSNPDDIVAMNAGQMPAYLRKKYKTRDPIDQWLMEQGLPYGSLFNDMYSEAWQERNERNAKKQQTYESAFGDMASYVNGMNSLRQAMLDGYRSKTLLPPGSMTSSETSMILPSGKPRIQIQPGISITNRRRPSSILYMTAPMRQ